MNTTTVSTSKFFVQELRKVQDAPINNDKRILFSEEDFDTLDQFKGAIASQVMTLAEQGAVLTFQHKPFLIGETWSIDARKLSAYALKFRCIVKLGNAENDYFWYIAPVKSVALAETELF